MNTCQELLPYQVSTLVQLPTTLFKQFQTTKVPNQQLIIIGIMYHSIWVISKLWNLSIFSMNKLTKTKEGALIGFCFCWMNLANWEWWLGRFYRTNKC